MGKMQGSQKRCQSCRAECSSGVSLFKFPLNEQRRQGWADFCGIDVSSVKSSYTLCSRHFTGADFKTRTLQYRKKQLKDDAMPTISSSSSVDHVSSSQFRKFPKCRKTPKDLKGKSRNQSCYICGQVDSILHRFVFPKDPSDLNVWLNACNLNPADLREGDRLCEAHFEEADIYTYPKLTKLRKGAFPSKLLPSQERAEMAISDDNRLLQTGNLNDFEKSCKDIQLDDGAVPSTFPASEKMFRLVSKRFSANLPVKLSPQVARYSEGQCDNPQVAVVLSGCGVYDGSEIHEAVSVLSHITRLGATPFIFAPKVKQLHVINHIAGEEEKGAGRCVLTESARIARGDIKPLSELVDNFKHFNAVIFPGGFGVAKNLSDFAVKGPQCTVNPEVAAILQGCHRSKIALGFICIAPILAARVLCNPTITLGNSSPSEKWPHKDAIEAAKSLGAVVEYKSVSEVSYDRVNKVYSTPAYMYNGKFHEIDDGIGNMIKFMFINLKHEK